MKCVVPKQNVKIVSRAVHSLARIGDEMFIEPTADDLLFRTVNLAQSAFVEFRMGRSFFSTFLSDQNKEQEMKFKITMKSCLSVFRNLHSMDKQVENCEIRVRPGGTVIIFQIKFTNSSVKKYYLPIIDSETVEAAFGQNSSNSLVASSKFLSSCLKHFRQSEDEITLTVNEEKLLIKNHLELSRDSNFMRTELCFAPSEFEQYAIGNPTKITFCLKEFRAVLTLAEPANLPVSLAFSAPGSPVIISVSNAPAYEASYIVSTLNSREMSATISGRSLSSSENRIQRLLSEESTPERGAPGPDPPGENVFNFSSGEDAQPQRPLREANSNSRLTPNIRSSLAGADGPRNNNFDMGRRWEGTPPGDGHDDNYEVPAHVSNLVKTVFARCFQKYNSLDLLPGNDIILAQNTQNISESAASNGDPRI